MTREEEILNASTEYHEEQYHCDGWNYDFIEGAKWSDQYPRKGLVDIDKIASFIKYHAQEFVYISIHSGETKINEFKLIEAMYKAMEE